MSLENSIKELTIAVNKLISILDKSNQDSNTNLSPLSLAVINLAKMASDVTTEPVIKMASEIIMEPEPAPTPTVKPVKKVSNPTPVATADEPVGTAMNIVEMRDAIRTMCSEMVQSDKKNKVGIEDIFSKFKATHLKMVNDATVPALYAHVLVFKGALK
jgi:hypothetical protein